MATVKVYATTQHLHVRMLIHYGKLSTPVEFTGGKLTSNGTTAATYSTSNETMQRFIEGSEEFRLGVIYLQRTIVDGNIARNVLTSKPAVKATAPIGAGTEANRTAADNRSETSGTGADDTVKSFERLADAKEWLQEMGVNTESIIKKNQAEQMANGMGYQIVWK